MDIVNNKNIRVIIIEDELHNSRMLNGMINKLRPDWKVEKVLDSVAESVEWLQNNPHQDLIMMDIQLSDGICFSIFQQIEISQTCRIIFTTAYDEFAIRAFKVNSIDYLLKPINGEELESAFQKFEKLTASSTANELLDTGEREHYKKLVDSILTGKKEYRSRFLISGVNDYYKLNVEDIAYIYSTNKLTFATDFKGKSYTLDYNLEQCESDLNPKHFFRANRKIIVNIDAIARVSNDLGSKLKVLTQPPTEFEVTISRLKATEFKYWMGK